MSFRGRASTRYLWCGNEVCQSRDGSDAIVGQYYGEGEIQGSTALYYVRDHLGTVKDVVNSQGRVLGQLAYGPYGEVEKAEGRLPDKRYAGMLMDVPNGNYITHYRFYDPAVGRWLNRDPMGESGGLNIYAYVGGNPLSYTDPNGLESMGDCVAQNRWDWGKLGPAGPEGTSDVGAAVTAGNVANIAGNVAAGPTGSGAGIGSHATSWAHRAGSNIGQALQIAENGRRFGSTQAAWSTAGKVLGRALILPTIFEGAYDIATIARCACTAK
jgi:RHS repeat-associated protein